MCMRQWPGRPVTVTLTTGAPRGTGALRPAVLSALSVRCRVPSIAAAADRAGRAWQRIESPFMDLHQHPVTSRPGSRTPIGGYTCGSINVLAPQRGDGALPGQAFVGHSARCEEFLQRTTESDVSRMHGSCSLSPGTIMFSLGGPEASLRSLNQGKAKRPSFAKQTDS